MAIARMTRRFSDQTSILLPRVKITELVMEVDTWTGVTPKVLRDSEKQDSAGHDGPGRRDQSC